MRGRPVLHDAQPTLKSLLCDADSAKSILSKLSKEALHATIVAIIAGTAGVSFTPLAILSLTAIVVRRGLQVYCAAPAAAAVPSAASPAS